MRFSIIPILCGLLIATACTRTVNDEEHTIKPPAPQQSAQTEQQTASPPLETKSENNKKEETKRADAKKTDTETSRKPVLESHKKETSVSKNEKSANPAKTKPATTQTKPATKNQSQDRTSAYTILEIEKEVVWLVNEERAKQGLPPLVLSTTLSKISRTKCEDMRDHHYFSHQSPTYGSPFDMLHRFGVNFQTAGENIAAGQRTAEEVVQSWMQSEGHRANILNPSYTQIGVGFVEGGNYGTLWTQIFVGK